MKAVPTSVIGFVAAVQYLASPYFSLWLSHIQIVCIATASSQKLDVDTRPAECWTIASA
jgi:hypothetical protein